MSKNTLFLIGLMVAPMALSALSSDGTKSFDQAIANSMQTRINSYFQGFIQFVNSNDFDKGSKDFSKAGTKVLNRCSQSLSDFLQGDDLKNANNDARKVLTDNMTQWGKELQKANKKGGDFDKGIQANVGVWSRAFKTLVINNYLKMSAITAATVGAYYTTKYGVPFAFKMLERYITRPKLIIASSKKTLYESWFGPKTKLTPREMVFTPQLKTQLDNLVTMTKTINKKIKEGKTNVKYRNLMLYGPPGTGKTLFATELAKQCGLEYAFMSGSSFSKFKDGEGIEALDELFAWANKSKGLLIFIDEAETFLLQREKMDPQSKAYLLLNNFLNYTGERSNKFMIVFATNHKEALDSAMYRRIDDLVEIPLPGKTERIKILNLYIKNILLDAKQNGQKFINSVNTVLTQAKIEAIAEKTKGLAASEIEGIVYGIKTSTDILDPAIVTQPLVDEVVHQAVKKYLAFTNGNPLGTVED